MATDKRTAARRTTKKSASSAVRSSQQASILNPPPESFSPFHFRSALTSMAELSFGTDRNLRKALGYWDEDRFNSDAYGISRYQWERGDVANRIINLPVNATWTDFLEIKNADGSGDGPFTYDDINSKLKLTRRMMQVDKLAGLGRFAVLFIGVRGDDEEMLDQPVEKGSLRPNLGDVLFLTPFSEKSARIKQWVTDTGDSRFGQPEIYELDMVMNARTGRTRKRSVHWSRVLHVADGDLETDLFGIPRLKKLINRLQDKEKIVGGAAEMYWQNADRFFKVLGGGDTPIDDDELKKIRDQVVKMQHRLSRVFVGSGIEEFDAIPASTVDPTGAWKVIQEIIAAAADIPVRILFGSERGELASTQDRDNFADRINERRTEFAEPLLRGFFDRLQTWSALAPGDYILKWPGMSEPSPEQRADTRVKNSTIVRNMVESGFAITNDTLESEYDLPGFDGEMMFREPEQRMLPLGPPQDGGDQPPQLINGQER